MLLKHKHFHQFIANNMFTPFNMLFLLVVATSGILAYFIRRHQGKNAGLRFVLTVVGVALIGFWLSLFLSYKQVEVPSTFYGTTEVQAHIRGISGFPFRTVEHPFVGNDIVPLPVIPGLLLNYAFWFIVSLSICLLWKKVEKYAVLWGAFGTTLIFIGFFYLLVVFD